MSLSLHEERSGGEEKTILPTPFMMRSGRNEWTMYGGLWQNCCVPVALMPVHKASACQVL